MSVDTAESDLTLSGVRLIGTLSSGQARTAFYDTPPTYRAYSFSAAGGDVITVDVQAVPGWQTGQADAVAMITDASYNVLAVNDDASPYTLDSRVTFQVPTLSGPAPFRVVFRDYNLNAARFEVRLTVQPASPSATCTYARASYDYGDEWAAIDGCNRCRCGVDGAVECSANACTCNPAAEPLRSYVGTPDQCLALRYTCGSGERPFSNACGCGCEPIP